jgi:hypothetical protein
MLVARVQTYLLLELKIATQQDHDVNQPNIADNTYMPHNEILAVGACCVLLQPNTPLGCSHKLCLACSLINSPSKTLPCPDNHPVP